MVLIASATIGIGGVTSMQGCATLGPMVPFAISVCVELVKSLLDLPREDLPEGYAPCGEPVVWNVRGEEIKFCFYCSLMDPTKLYMRFGCTGKYYPLRLRSIGGADKDPDTGLDTGAGGIGIDKIGCDERLLLKAQSTYDEWADRASASFESPNARYFPDPDPYASLSVSVDGVPIADARDFMVGEGQRVSVEGSLEEVAHYAMACGVTEAAFEVDGVLHEVFVNPDVSAMMVFKNGVCIDKRLLFAPTP